MKRIISILLIISSFLLCALPALAQECEHVYLREFISANCTEKSHTKYTCRRCSHVYKVYDDEYTAPEELYILAKSERAGSTLTVTVDLFNNPGLTAGRVKVSYNASTLSLREFINGDVWSDRDYTGGIKIESNPFSVFTEDYTTGLMTNQNNGRYFTLVFDILDPDGEYNMSFSSSKGDFHSWNQKSSFMTYYTLSVVNLVGKSELGPHSYTETTVPPTCASEGYTLHECSLCGDSYEDSFVEKAPHSFEFSSVIANPTFTTEGIHEYICTECGETESRSVPVLERWMKGDLNNDNSINAIDTNLFRRLLVGYPFSVQAIDAADLDENGEINAKDAYRLKLLVSGK